MIQRNNDNKLPGREAHKVAGRHIIYALVFLSATDYNLDAFLQI